MHIILHALHLLVVVQCVTVMNIRLEQHTALIAKTEQFTTTKISGCANVLSNSSREEKVCGWDGGNQGLKV